MSNILSQRDGAGDLKEYDAMFAAAGWRRTGCDAVGDGYSMLTVEPV